MENIITTPTSSQNGQTFISPIKGNVPLSTNSGIGSMFDSWLKSQTGSGLTIADKESNAFSAEQAEINRDWQEEMSNTAYQRAVDDMRSAGLNPALLFGHGTQASSPGGSFGSSSRGATGLSLSELLALSKIRSEIKLLDAQASKVESDSELTRKQIGTWDSEVNAKIDNLKANTDKYVADIREIDSRIDLNTAQKLLTLAETDLRNAQIESVKNQSKLFIEEANLKREQIRKIASDINLNSWQTHKLSKEIGLISWQTKKTASEAGMVGIQSRSADLSRQLLQHQVDVLKDIGITSEEAFRIAEVITKTIFGLGFILK